MTVLEPVVQAVGRWMALPPVRRDATPDVRRIGMEAAA
jgi:hypothetical protein